MLDTNIFIKRESSDNVSFEVNNLFNWFDKKNVKKYLHKTVVDELNTHKDEKIKNTMLTKVSSYDMLPSFMVDEKFGHIRLDEYMQEMPLIKEIVLLQLVGMPISFLLN